MTPHEQDAIEQAKAILTEHFPNFALVVLTDADGFFYDYSNTIVGKALFREALDDVKRAEQWIESETIFDDDDEE